jgi:hypothetical protein
MEHTGTNKVKLWDNILGEFLSHYTNFLDAKESYWNYCGVVGMETHVEFYSKKLIILPLMSQYILSIFVHVVNKEMDFL